MPLVVRSLWREPAVPNPPARVWRDWVLVAVVAATALIELILRSGVIWPWAAVALLVLVSAGTLWRRTHPLVVVLVVFGANLMLTVLAPVQASEPFGLYTMAVGLVLPYALGRWASGRDVIVGLTWILLTAAIGQVVIGRPMEIVAAFAFVLTAAALGVAVRSTTAARRRQVEQYRLLEREQLARELHDTVAHHVSAIAIQAQAAQVVGVRDPEAVDTALRTIESEATRALTEMRALVGTLRDGEEAALVPQRCAADVRSLASTGPDGLQVTVLVDGDVSGLPPAVDAAVFRIAQESVTNALRHARGATRVQVCVAGDAGRVRVEVTDDGLPASEPPSAGFGLVGMAERVALLGGTFEAGPRPEGGWQVVAVLPRTGWSA